MKRIIQNKFGIIYFFFVLLVLGLIFYFSSNNASTSGALSTRVLKLIIRVFNLDEGLAMNATANILVRKAAHFSLFALLGTGLRGFFGSLYIRHKAIFSLIVGFLAACGDELHQLFVPGRAGMFTDVLIDMCGVTAGVVFVSAIDWAVERIKEKKNSDV